MSTFVSPDVQDKSFFLCLGKFCRGDRNVLWFLEEFIKEFLSGLAVFLMILRLFFETSSCNFILIGFAFNSASKGLVNVDFNGHKIRDKAPL